MQTLLGIHAIRWFGSAIGLLVFHVSQSQTPIETKGLYLGVGIGQDVGGIIGARLSYWPVPWAGAFAGGGWLFVGGGYNAGVELRVPSERRTSPFAVGMYGYNAVIAVDGKEAYDRIYYGPTVGAGVMVRQSNDRNYWRFSVNLPFRSPEFEEDIDQLKKQIWYSDVRVPLPLTLGFGYHIGL